MSEFKDDFRQVKAYRQEMGFVGIFSWSSGVILHVVSTYFVVNKVIIPIVTGNPINLLTALILVLYMHSVSPANTTPEDSQEIKVGSLLYTAFIRALTFLMVLFIL